MLEGNTDEIRMEIHSQFVEQHEYWESRRGKNWIAKITGLDTTYGYKREFLKSVKVGTKKVFHLEDFHIGEIYEVGSVYTGGGFKRINVKDTFECAEITETHIVLRYVSQDEVIKRLGEKNTDIIAQNLVRQLLRIVTTDQALKLIQHYG
ncbi:MAG: hypothetical protein HXS48_15780 [Theionarchaea archaeon]|nr:hypothetical protein [Theionarchaea archaeon]